MRGRGGRGANRQEGTSGHRSGQGARTFRHRTNRGVALTHSFRHPRPRRSPDRADNLLFLEIPSTLSTHAGAHGDRRRWVSGHRGLHRRFRPRGAAPPAGLGVHHRGGAVLGAPQGLDHGADHGAALVFGVLPGGEEDRWAGAGERGVGVGTAADEQAGRISGQDGCGAEAYFLHGAGGELHARAVQRQL